MIRIEYQRDFSHFVDNYLVGYYRSVPKFLAGPAIILVGAFLFVYARSPNSAPWMRFFLYPLGFFIILRGIWEIFRPLIDIGLVVLRKDDFLGPEGTKIALELHPEGIRLYEDEGHVDIPYDQINSIQRRANSAWIIAEPDNLIYVPGENLLSGDHEAFLEHLEERLAYFEEQHG